MADQGRPLTGQKAVVIGAGAIGSAIARGLAHAGADVGVTYSSKPQSAEQVVRSITAMSRHAVAMPCDVTNAAGTAAMLVAMRDALGALDIVVNAVGGAAAWARITELDPDDWASYIATDLSGTFHVLRAAAPLMRQRGGAIVVLSSIAASMFQSRNGQGAAAKAGVEALVRVLAREEGRHNIRVNAVAVGLTESPAADVAFAKWGDAAAERVVRAIPLQRIAKPDEIANAVVFLAGPSGQYITGKVLAVDGGQYIGH